MSKKLLHKTKIVKIYHDKITHDNGFEEEFEYISLFNDTFDSVMVAAITERNEVIFIDQFLPAIGKRGLILPGGKVDAGESIEKAAARELAEETQFYPKKVQKIISVEILPKYVYGQTHFFIAKELTFNKEFLGDEVENIKLVRIPIKTLISEIKSGRISDSRSVALSLIAYTELGGC